MSAEKQLLRKEILALRNDLTKDIKDSLDERIYLRVMDYLQKNKPKCVLCYASYGSEVATYAIIEYLLKNEINVCLPRVNGDEMEFYTIDSLDDLEEGYKGIYEPKMECKLYTPCGSETIFIPGVVFDRRLFRIGYGKGFYDRYLGRFYGLKRVGIAYSCQVVDKISIDKWDKGLDLIITEKGELYYD